jgi:alpha-amylase/alpha-mannosidase (GH57 family)
MKKYLCVHCHFYQPPRENPWLEEIEYQESAYPFHDWNEKITQECYRTNGEAQILDQEGWVVDVVNNYSKISFNFGPTLLSWMQTKDPETYQRILEGDKESLRACNGHGNAIAQAYNHIIMPLANARDKETQVIWGLADFEKRFGRFPESMWLPETAVDLDTVEILARHGLKYIILAPRQAKSWRKLSSVETWNEITNEQFDIRRPYLLRLPSGNTIAVFFYSGIVSKAVAFEGLLHNGETFAIRLNSIFEGASSSQESQLAAIATDGETYGHHHRHGEMALAYALRYSEEKNQTTVVNYGQFLEIESPQYEVQIYENSSWSCFHGIERWRSNCGCSSEQRPGWNQNWRAPLREAFDFIRDKINPYYEKTISNFVRDPWKARNAYIRIILDRSDETLQTFLNEYCTHALNDVEVNLFLKLLEIQRHLLLMYTSCGWFFDELSGVETVQNLQYAYRAIDLSKDALSLHLEDEFKELLAKCPSNIPELKDGEMVFQKYVAPAKVSFSRLGAHFAVDSVFREYQSENQIYCYRILLDEQHVLPSGRAKLSWGHGTITSNITRKKWPMVYGVIHLGDHNINAGVADFFGTTKYKEFSTELERDFRRADFPNVIRTLDKWFVHSRSSLKDLFKNEQHKVTDAILRSSTKQIQDRLTEIYDKDYPLICYLSSMKIPLPKIYMQIAEYVQNRQAEEAIHEESGSVDIKVLNKYLAEALNWKIKLDEPGLSRRIEATFEYHLRHLETHDHTKEGLNSVLQLIEVTKGLPFAFDLAPIQSLFFNWFRTKWLKSDLRQISELSTLVTEIGSGLKVRLLL